MSGFNQFVSQLLTWFQWWVVIAPWEMAIRVRHGNKIYVLSPGVHLRIPGLDRFFIQRIRKRYMTTPTQTVTTLDKQAITVSGGTAYNIADIGKLYNTLSDAEDVIQIETLACIAQYISSRNLIDITLSGLQDYVTQCLKLDQYGLGDISFCITDFVCVKTYRLIQASPKDWSSGQSLNTQLEKIMGAPPQ